MKNKINNIVKSLAVAALGMLSLSSCNDFLTIYPTDKRTSGRPKMMSHRW